MHKKNQDILILLVLPLLGSFIAILLKTNLLISTFIFFGLPILYLLTKKIHGKIRFLILSFFTAFTFGFFLDYLASFNNAWNVPTIFPFLFLGEVPLEDLIWGALYVYLIGMFYIYFFNKGKRFSENHSRKKYFMIASVFLVGIPIALHYTELGGIPYYYFFAGVFASFLPPVIFLFFHPKRILSFLLTGIYFSYVSLVNELTALYLHHWSFPSKEYIGWVTLLNLQFPFEELLFFIITGSLAVLTYYLLFFVDPKELR